MLLLALACTSTPDDTASDAVDMQRAHPTPGDGEIGWAVDDLRVEAYADTMTCTVFTYSGETVGITSGAFYQHPDYGHHTVIMVSNVSESDVPDGSQWDCTSSEALSMVDLEPLVMPSAGDATDGYTALTLPDGMGVKFREGTRVLVQSHYINPTDTAILVNDAINLEVVPEAEIETWAAPWVHTETDFELPEGESELVVDCSFDQDLNLLSVLGHMHEWGTRFSIDYVSDAGTERIYEIEDWDVTFRDAPPVDEYAPGAFSVKAGDSFKTTCSYDNDTGAALGFPNEMCVSVGLAYPATVPVMCEVD